MITMNLSGAVAEYINGRDMIENPSTADERAFADYWTSRTERVDGRGYRATLTAPAWVFNWIADDAEMFIDNFSEDASAAEIRAAGQ